MSSESTSSNFNPLDALATLTPEQLKEQRGWVYLLSAEGSPEILASDPTKPGITSVIAECKRRVCIHYDTSVVAA